MAYALQQAEPMTLVEYEAFVDERSDFRLWELIDGELVLNAMPTDWHQMVVGNIQFELDSRRREKKADWHVLPGLGVRARGDDNNEPAPDALVVPELSNEARNWTHDVLVIFEVLSKSTARRDMTKKRAFYTALEPLQHYVVLAQDRMEATIFSRTNGFEPVVLDQGDAMLTLPELDVEVRLADLYSGIAL